MTDLSILAIDQITNNSSVFNSLMAMWNAAALAIGTIIMGYIVIAGVIKTAHEGEALGEKWSSIFTPLRAAIAMALLVPTASGLSSGQFLALYGVKQGTQLANAMWSNAQSMLSNGTALPYTLPPSQSALEAFKQIAQVSNCLSAVSLNHLTDLPINLSIYKQLSDDTLKLTTTDSSGQYKNGFCGQIVWDLGGSTIESKAVADGQANAMIIASQKLTFLIQNQQGIPPDFSDVLNTLNQQWQQAAQLSIPQDKSDQSAAKSDGWISAGSYYRKIINRSSEALDTASMTPTFLAPVEQPIEMQKTIEDSMITVNLAIQRSDPSSQTAAASDKNVSGWSSLIHPFQALQHYAILLIKSEPDPILRCSNIGHYLLDTAWASIALNKTSKVIPAGKAASFLNILPDENSTFVLALFILGGLLGYVLPSIPYIIFTLSSFAWLINVITLLIAVPLWTISHASPDGHDAFGAGGSGYLKALGVILQPALIIIGLLIGMSILTAGDTLLSAGFEAAFFNAQVNSTTGLIGLVIGLVMYSILMFAMIFGSFRMMKSLPSAVLGYIDSQVNTESSHSGAAVVGALQHAVIQKSTAGAASAAGVVAKMLPKNSQLL